MMNRKKAVSACLAAVFVLSCILAGCSGNGDGTQTSEIELPPEEQTVIENTTPYAKHIMKNPLGVTGIGDPFILYSNVAYYMYATSLGTGFKVWKSTDARRWSNVGVAYQKSGTSFGNTNYWAPEVYSYNGKYYLFYSAQYNKDGGGTSYAIGCAVSDSPTGPFTDIIPGKPVYNPGYAVIDANVLFDKSGKIYLYYSRDCSENVVSGRNTSQIYGIELAADLKSVIGEPVLVSTPDAAWETVTGNTVWNEGPCVFERDGIYYLMYSAGCYADNSYSVGYATSDSPLGTYTKNKSNPILKGDGTKVSGSGHNNYFMSPDGTEMYAVYHSHTNPAEGGGNRQLCIDKIVFGEDGSLSVNGPTFFSRPVPSGTLGTYILKPDEYVLSAGDGVISVKGSIKKAANGILQATVGRVAGDAWTFSPSGSYIRMALKSPGNLSYVALYGDPNNKKQPGTVTAVINGIYRIENVAWSADYEPTIIGFGNLPEGTNISKIDFYFDFGGGDGNLALKEIIAARVKK